MSRHDDPERDPHLRTALHHAPDHDVTPPPKVSAAILQAARAAAKPATPTARPWWRHWLEVQPMQWAGAAAGLLVAVLAGRLWWDNPPELREPAAAPAPASVPAEAPASAAAPAPVAAQAPVATVTGQAPAPAPKAAASPAPKVREEALKAERAAVDRRAANRQQAATAADKAEEVAATPARPTQPAPATAGAAAPPTPAAPAPVAAAAPAPAPAVPARGLAQEAERKQDAAAPALRARVPAAESQASTPPLNLAPTPKSATLYGRTPSEPPGIERLRRSAGEPASWTWERRAVEPSSATASSQLPLSAWVQQLLQAGAGRWEQQPRDTQPAGESLAWIGTWRIDGELRAIVSLQGRVLWWREPDGSTWTATLPPTAAEALAQPPL